MTDDPGSLPPGEIIALTAPLEAALLSFTATIQQAGLTQSKWVYIAVCDLEQAIKELSPVWSGRKHSRLLAAKYHTAADWIRSQGRTVNQNDAGSLTARTARYLERNRIAGDGIDGDRNLVVELVRRKRIVRYFPSWALEAVDQFGWSAKTSVIADAQAELAYLQGPLKPPPPPKSKRQRTNKTTIATSAKERKNNRG